MPEIDDDYRAFSFFSETVCTILIRFCTASIHPKRALRVFQSKLYAFKSGNLAKNGPNMPKELFFDCFQFFQKVSSHFGSH